jgi:hypothetical protein
MFNKIGLCVDLKILFFFLSGQWIWWFEFLIFFSYLERTKCQCVIIIYRQGSNTLLVHFVLLYIHPYTQPI